MGNGDWAGRIGERGGGGVRKLERRRKDLRDVGGSRNREGGGERVGVLGKAARGSVGGREVGVRFGMNEREGKALS